MELDAFLAPTQYYVCDRACVCGVVNILQLWMDSIYMEYNMEELQCSSDIQYLNDERSGRAINK